MVIRLGGNGPYPTFLVRSSLGSVGVASPDGLAGSGDVEGLSVAWTFIAQAGALDIGTGTALDATSTLDVQAGDVLIAVALCYGSGPPTATISDGGSNNLTVVWRDNSERYTAVNIWSAHLLSAATASGATFTLTFSASVSYRTFRILQYRPSSGSTVSLESATDFDNQVQSDTVVTATFDVPSGDTLVIAMNGHAGADSKTTASNHEVDGVAADGAYSGDDYVHIWGKALSTSKTGIDAGCTLGSVKYWFGAGALVFKATAGGTTAVPVFSHHYATMARN